MDESNRRGEAVSSLPEELQREIVRRTLQDLPREELLERALEILDLAVTRGAALRRMAMKNAAAEFERHWGGPADGTVTDRHGAAAVELDEEIKKRAAVRRSLEGLHG